MVKTGALFQDEDDLLSSDGVDKQEVLVELLKLRANLKTEKDKGLKTEEENTELKRQLAVLQGKNDQLMEALRRFEKEALEAEKFVQTQMDTKGEPEMTGLTTGDDGYWEARCKVLEKRVTGMAKHEYWLQAEVEQAKDLAADARRRQVDAERFLGELLRDRADLYHNHSDAELDQKLTGSHIFDSEKPERVEGLPKTIPSRAARAAGLLTALGNSASLRSTVGRTVAGPSGGSMGPGVAPTARPGNIWATLMNGGAAGGVTFS